jgi:hypothetical protein
VSYPQSTPGPTPERCWARSFFSLQPPELDGSGGLRLIEAASAGNTEVPEKVSSPT